MEWWKKSTFYQIYPLGFCNAERENDFVTRSNRLPLISREIPRLKSMGVGAVLFNPLFLSQSHGYDTADFFEVDNRLGDSEGFKELTQQFHAAGIKVVLDGVFNHVGRKFKEFEDVLKNGANSRYKHFFKIDFNGNSCYNDGFYYEGWEGHYNLVKLNLDNGEVRQYLFDAVRKMIDFYDIDGLRLDVGYLLPSDFISQLRGVAEEKKNGFFIVAEAIHGDYNRLLAAGADSVTNYECYKGLHSAINSKNLFEIEHSLSRQFADTQWALYKGRHLFNFVDNHDVPRAYTIIKDKKNVAAMYAVLFCMPGIPCIYYGSEYGAQGDKGDCDVHLRAAMSEIDAAAHPEIYDAVCKLIKLRAERKSLQTGSYEKVVLSNEYMCFVRRQEGEGTALAVNISDAEVTANTPFGGYTDLLNGSVVGGNAVTLAPHSFKVLDVSR